jgi:acyl carrier protein
LECEEILKRLELIFRDVFDNDDIELAPEMTAKDVEEWDSLGHIRLIGAVEAEFNVRFDLPEIEELSNVGEFMDLLVSKIER